jgi:LPXTG-site transpeptidase (sortase) family protein
VAGVTLLWGAIALAGYAVGWQSHARSGGAQLLDRERTLIHKAAAAPGATPCQVEAASTGQLAGMLHIGALKLDAPVEQGTTDGVLNVSVGHDATSVWPGTNGAAVLLAHDVSYFDHLGELKPGDLVDYRTACTTTTFRVTDSHVVAAGTTLPNSADSSLILDTCYPPDALFFTSQRLVVDATELTSRPNTAGHGDAGSVPSAPSYTVPVPPALAAQGLTLEHNEVPMGSLSLSGQTTPNFEQSPGPLDLEAAALEAYFGGLHAAAQTQHAWWSSIAQPGVAIPQPLDGAQITGHDAPLNVEIVSSQATPSAVVLTTTVTVSGGAAPGTYAESVRLGVAGGSVTIAGWSMQPAGA